MNAHGIFHIAIGMSIGTLIVLPSLMKAILSGNQVSEMLRRAGVIIYGLGAFAMFPSLLRRLGVPDAVCDGWWMNLFAGYSLIKQHVDGGMLIGELLVTLQVLGHYALLMLLLWKVSRRQNQASTEPHQP